VVLSFDEKGKTAVKQYGGQKYVFKNYYHIPYGQTVSGLCDLVAARNICTGEIHYKFYDWKNSYIVIDFIEEIKKAYPGKTLYIIWDGWSAHRSACIQNYLALHPEVHILPLPTRASWLNPIERDFGLIQRFVLNNSNFKTVTETINAVENYIEKELSTS
jgi:hypothetical protein